jgi:hypothetical protein
VKDLRQAINDRLRAIAKGNRSRLHGETLTRDRLPPDLFHIAGREDLGLIDARGACDQFEWSATADWHEKQEPE